MKFKKIWTLPEPGLKSSDPFSVATIWCKPLKFQLRLFDITEFIVWNMQDLRHLY